MKKAFLAVVLVIVCMAWAQEAPESAFSSKEDCKQMCAEFVELVIDGKIDDAFEKIKAYWLFGESELEKVHVQTVKQMGLVEPRFGKTVGYEFVTEKNVNDTVLRLTYIQKFERHIVRWVFTFYKPKDVWLLNAFTWDDDIDELFQ